MMQWWHLIWEKARRSASETQLDSLMTARTRLIFNSKFTRNCQTQPNSIPSQRSKTVNRSLLHWGCSRSGITWGVSAPDPVWCLKRSHFSYGRPPFYTYTLTPMPSYSSPRTAPDITQTMQVTVSMDHWPDRVPDSLVIQFTSQRRTQKLTNKWHSLWDIFHCVP